MGRKQKQRIPKKNNKSCSGKKSQIVELDALRSAAENHPDDVQNRLRLAEYYLLHSNEELISETLDCLEQQYPLADSSLTRWYDILKAYGCAHNRQYMDAETITIRLLERYPDSLDGYFISAFVHLSLRELQQAEQACKKYISLCKSEKLSQDEKEYANTPAHLSQVHNFLGTINQEQGETLDAVRYFEKAIAAHAGNYLPYLNLATLLERTDKIDAAREVVEKGIKHCSQVQELRLLDESLKRSASISVCMIVKDEEELLPGCLDSVRDWVDEIIMVDTGSSDRTVEIAKSYGARLHFQEWEGDFSKHRNYSLEQATGDWIFIIDADERINQDDVTRVRRHINSGKYRVLAVNVFNYSGKFNEKVTSLASVRFFKRELGLRYKGIVHNQLEIDPSEPVLRTDIRIEHLGYGLSRDRMTRKAARTIELLKQQLEENPDNAFALFNYAQVLMGMDFSEHPENPSDIIKAATRAVELTNPESVDRSERDIHLMSLQQLALTYFIINNCDESEKHALCALKHKPDYLDTMLLLGNINLRRNNIDTAEKYFQKYLKTQQEYEKATGIDEILLLHPRSFHHAYYGLGIVAEGRQQWDKAKQYYLDVLKYSPEFLDANARLGHIHFRLRQHQEAAECFKKQLEYDSSSHLAMIGLAGVCFEQHQYEEADQYTHKVLTTMPDEHPALHEYAQFLIGIGREGEATRFFHKAASAQNLTGAAQRRLAESYFHLGEFQDAARLYLQLIKTEGPTSELLNDLGGCYFKIGDYEEAESYYQQAVTLSDSLPISLRNLGLARVRGNKPAEAINPLKEYLEVTDNDNEIVELVGDLHLQTGDFNLAIPLFERVLRTNPDNTWALYKLSECYLNMGHRDSAILGYQRVLQIDSRFQPALKRLSDLLSPVVKD